MRKADFQMSMGFIVAIVFAVILLTLAISWIQGLFSNIEELTHKTTEIAQKELLEKLSSGGVKVGLAAPDVTEWQKGDTGSYTLGIKNDDDVKSVEYHICIFQENEVGADTDEWFDYTKKEIIGPDEQTTAAIVIKPTPGSSSGIYRFRIVVNQGGESFEYYEDDDCKEAYTIENEYLYGSELFAIEILP